MPKATPLSKGTAEIPTALQIPPKLVSFRFNYEKTTIVVETDNNLILSEIMDVVTSLTKTDSPLKKIVEQRQ